MKVLKASKTENKMIRENQQMLDLLLKETEAQLSKWSEVQYKEDVKKGRSLFKSMKRSF